MENIKLINGVFIKEAKNRFICEVEINGSKVECYVPSSCRLSNFLKLEGKTVLLKQNENKKGRTKFALFAVPHKKSYLLLNSSLANHAIEANIFKRRFSFLGKRIQIFKEHNVEGYKADLFITDSNTIIEIKSIISLSKSAVFPTVYSARAIEQLKLLRELLEKGYKVCYIIVSLNPYVNEIVFDTTSHLFELFNECKALGMQAKGFSCIIKASEIIIKKEINLSN